MSLSITNIFPPDTYNIFPLGESIQILFSEELSSFLAENSIVLVGPEKLSTVGPYQEVTENNLMNTSFAQPINTLGWKGQVPIKIDVIKCDLEGNELEDQLSTDSDEESCSKVIITPINLLSENTVYELYLGGGSLEYSTAYIGTKSVYDIEPDEGNTSSGIILSSGISNIDDIVNIEIVKTGSQDNVKFKWSLASLPGIEKIVSITSNKVKLSKDIYLTFYGTENNSFVAGDTYSIVLKPVQYLENTYKLTFSTANNQVKNLPSETSQSVIGLLEPSESTVEENNVPFTLDKIVPGLGSSNLSLSTGQVILTFSKPVLSSSVNNRTVQIMRSNVNNTGSSQVVPATLIVDDNKIIINLTREDTDASN